MFPLGEVSSGTLRIEDLLSVATEEYRYMAETHGNDDDRVSFRHYCALVEDVNTDSDEAFEIYDEIEEILNDFAPAYVYFGLNPDDGASIGWWPDIEALEEAALVGEVHKINDLSELDDLDYSETNEIMLVNDHGNVSYGHVHGDLNRCPEFHEVWSCV